MTCYCNLCVKSSFVLLLPVYKGFLEILIIILTNSQHIINFSEILQTRNTTWTLSVNIVKDCMQILSNEWTEPSNQTIERSMTEHEIHKYDNILLHNSKWKYWWIRNIASLKLLCVIIKLFYFFVSQNN